MSIVAVGEGARQVSFGNDRPLALIAGPCALESREMALEVAAELALLSDRLGIGVVFKASFDKANRTSSDAPRGLGLEASLPILAEVKEKTGLPVTTDVHESWQCARVAEVVDLLQIPAFLCRQTDLIVAAARTGRPVNIKKGQFLAPWDMEYPAEKARAAGAAGVLLTERGTSFGYNALVADMRALPIMQETGAQVIFDATHSVQQPGGRGGSSGGDRRFVAALARAAVAVGVAGLFVETHPNPDAALSDSATQLPLRDLGPLVETLMGFDRLAKSFTASS
ncbi:3-deoxy-8-phosphooctulonate synthase [Methylocystis sp. MJC1]|jgi:2-dehydro-3-deoxyphosphooctonate aldolase (KDO 8-P synthase)|uniref:3-deoxy-8-phosphooctulonate synthase n=1 Tax=Methylocystis sp. MJC1 TaxID=2654282 RepID=UPI0013ECA30F|nr:3-deoxy-8-phosphooctulonate synthase [Methylocystis sp. MJC1]MBU6528232.1 3-deoxy-8-phosphooctulonate synthase [Methylocystis sp. MJC1]UZX11141.1 3-deoxy-8-phosphooctulonate synthase [Methylocystis sp. MJC1]